MAKQKPKFHCKSEAQKNAIRRSYAIKAKQQEQVMPSKPPFKLPLKNGEHIWNIYKVSNKILNGKQDGQVHGGLVLNEKNENVMLVQVTHSQKKGKRNNFPVRNLDSSDLDTKGNLKDSYIERRLIVSNERNGVEQGINVSALNGQMNDLQFSNEEKQKILDELSHLSTAEEKYRLFEKLAKEKAR